MKRNKLREEGIRWERGIVWGWMWYKKDERRNGGEQHMKAKIWREISAEGSELDDREGVKWRRDEWCEAEKIIKRERWRTDDEQNKT